MEISMSKRLDATNWKEYIDRLERLQRGMSAGQPLANAIMRVKRALTDFSVTIPDQLADIENSYNMMRDYMLQGLKDDSRGDLYNHLCRQLYRILSNSILDTKVKYDYLASLRTTQNTDELDIVSLRSDLESFVSDLAMLSLNVEGNEEDRRKALYENRQSVISRAFITILKSGQWSHEMTEDMTKLMLSPTIDINDALVLCSAVLMACLLCPDAEKVLALIGVYESASDEKLRQRAFVGWAFAYEAGDYRLFPNVSDKIKSLLKDDRLKSEIGELQLQVIYCRGAERDNESIQKRIIPTIIKNQNLEATRFGIREKEEDPMDDILHGDETDKRIEEMENNIQKMADMQKQGVDVYFGGFSKMKRFGFFYTLCNWFMPFYVQHPDLQHLSENMLQSGFMKSLFDHGPFCDSDKYSFALGLSSVYDSLPDNVKEVMASGGNVEVIGANTMGIANETFIRRLYLQDLYRFFRINDSRKAFHDPFRLLFMDDPVYRPELHDEAMRVFRFLLKRHQEDDAEMLLECYYDADNPTDVQLRGRLSIARGEYSYAEKLFKEAFEKDSENKQTLKGLAIACFHCGHYTEAAEYYSKLSELYPDKKSYKLNLAVSLINDHKEKEGENVLYELYYMYPDDINVRRALAWDLLSVKKLDRAVKLYDGILESDDVVAVDCLNAGYCAWFSGDLQKAANRFSEYNKKAKEESENTPVSLLRQFREDAALLDAYEIPQIDRLIMAGEG